MEKFCIIFGGSSVEHDISVLTAFLIADKVKSKIDFEKIYLSKDNRFYLVTKAKKPSDILSIKNYTEIIIYQNAVYKKGIIMKKLFDISAMLNCCHGGLGENGGLASICEFNNIKLTSSDSLAGHITMDKNLTKLSLGKAVPTIEGVLIKKQEAIDNKAIQKLGNDLIVKPNSLGSSIGVNVAGQDNHKDCCEVVFALGDDALIEKRIKNLTEYNQACFIDNGELIVSEIEQPLTKSEILSFDDKYVREGKTKLKDRIIAPPISEDLRKKITTYTKAAYKKLNLNGVVRIDYIYDNDNRKLYFNEVNTVPGSLAYYLYEPIGIDCITLIEKLLNNAQTKKYQYLDTGLLKKFDL